MIEAFESFWSAHDETLSINKNINIYTDDKMRIEKISTIKGYVIFSETNEYYTFKDPPYPNPFYLLY